MKNIFLYAKDKASVEKCTTQVNKERRKNYFQNMIQIFVIYWCLKWSDFNECKRDVRCRRSTFNDGFVWKIKTDFCFCKILLEWTIIPYCAKIISIYFFHPKPLQLNLPNFHFGRSIFQIFGPIAMPDWSVVFPNSRTPTSFCLCLGLSDTFVDSEGRMKF